jgi:aromatic ring-opening dioxygenase catalytic subunit (LigB family)
MGEVLGLGCRHAPMILNPAQQWTEIRKNIFGRTPNYQPPAKLIEELGDDNGARQGKINQQLIVDTFSALRDKLHAWDRYVVIVVGDDQAENFKRENLPTFCLFTGSEVDGYPFHRAGAKINLWNAPQDAKYSFKSPSDLSWAMVAYLIREGFDISSATELNGWQWGLPHAHINPMMFLNQDGKLPILQLFVNCYGEEVGEGYPPRPTAKRCYELGQAIRRFLDSRPERVAIVASSSWSHGFLTHKFNCCQVDEEFDRRTLGWLKEGKGSKVAELTPEEIQQSGDHEFLNWVITLGVVGDKPAEIVDVLDAQSQVSFKVFAIWE